MDTKSWTKINLEYKTGLSTVGNVYSKVFYKDQQKRTISAAKSIYYNNR